MSSTGTDVKQEATVQRRRFQFNFRNITALGVVGWILSLTLAALIILPLGRMIGDAFVVNGAIDFSPFTQLFADFCSSRRCATPP